MRSDHQPSSQVAGDDRVAALSDAVFAFAMTLLVLGLKPPERSEISPAALSRYVLDLWPAFLVWLISFAVIASFWLAHRRLFAMISGHDDRLAWLNMLLLLSIAFLPFPTALLGSYSDSQFAIIFYGSSLFGASLVMAVMGWYAGRGRRFIDENTSAEAIRIGVIRGAAAATVCLLSIPLSFVSLRAATLSWILVPLAQRWATARVKRKTSAET